MLLYCFSTIFLVFEIFIFFVIYILSLRNARGARREPDGISPNPTFEDFHLVFLYLIPHVTSSMLYKVVTVGCSHNNLQHLQSILRTSLLIPTDCRCSCDEISPRFIGVLQGLWVSYNYIIPNPTLLGLLTVAPRGLLCDV